MDGSDQPEKQRDAASWVKSVSPSLFDLCDLIPFFAGHMRPSGIQRVLLHLIHEMMDKPELFAKVEFVSFDARRGQYVVLDRVEVLLTVNHIIKNGMDDLTQKRFIQAELGDYSLFKGRALDWSKHEKTPMLIVGAGWCNDNAPLLRQLKAQGHVHLVYMVYDLIAIRQPEYTHAGTSVLFDNYLNEVLELADEIVTISDYVRDDVKALARQRGRDPAGVRSIRMGAFDPPQASLDPADSANLGVVEPYVLFVATIEARKNHQLIIDIWTELLREGEDPPMLVLVGRWGWLVDGLRRTMEDSEWLWGRILHLSNVSDEQLVTLYRGAKFVVFPSFAEGWGLPVTEAIRFGAPVLASSATAIPEAGGGAAVYLDPTDKPAWKRAIKEWIAHPNPREDIDFTSYEPPSWGDALRDFMIRGDEARDSELQAAPAMIDGREHLFASPMLKSSDQEALLSALCNPPARINPEALSGAQMRRGPGWLTREGFGAWSSFQTAVTLTMQLPPQAYSHLCFDLRFLEGAIGDRLTLWVGDEPARQVRITKQRMVLAAALGPVRTNEALTVRLRHNANAAYREAILRDDGRPLGAGFRSVFLAQREDALTWSRVVLALARDRGDLVQV